MQRSAISFIRWGSLIVAAALCTACAQTPTQEAWQGTYSTSYNPVPVGVMGPSAGIF